MDIRQLFIKIWATFLIQHLVTLSRPCIIDISALVTASVTRHFLRHKRQKSILPFSIDKSSKNKKKTFLLKGLKASSFKGKLFVVFNHTIQVSKLVQKGLICGNFFVKFFCELFFVWTNNLCPFCLCDTVQGNL